MKSELLRQSIVEERVDGTKTTIPLQVFPGIEVKDIVARKGLGLALMAGGIALAADLVLQTNNFVRGCVNENILRVAMGSEPVGLKTCAAEGFKWIVQMAQSGSVWK